MLALFVVILMISTQNQADGISRPTQRSKKMLYGKSRLTFQPFLCKSENADASLGGRTETNPSSPITKIDVTSTDSLNSVEDRIKTVRDFMNPIQILEAMNMQRNLQPSTSTDSKILKISEDKKPVSSVTPERSLMVPAQQQQQRSWQKAKTSTGSANIYWRSVDVDDLRSHPFFSSLPSPEDVLASNPAEYSLFRQDSWQWGALHEGRLTTARAAACLGFYEQESARLLKVPRSLSGHSKALHAYEHLQDPAPDSWDFINQDYFVRHPKDISKGVVEDSAPSPIQTEEGEIILLKARKKGGYQSRPEEGAKPQKLHQKKSDVWIPSMAKNVAQESTKTNSLSNGSRSSFPYTYRPKGKHVGTRGYSSASSARMAWGSSQEATAVLVAVNYFHTHGMTGTNSRGESTHTTVEEAGMFPFEALSDPLPAIPQGSLQLLEWVKDGSLPLIGASPDGMLRHPDGSCEVLEVKCHSPFIETGYLNRSNGANSTARNSSGRGGGRDSPGGLSISDRGAADSVATWHIPQLQLHILCAGPSCTGAVLVSLSATKGANIFRVKRDDEYIMRMMTWIKKFYVTYVLPSKKNIPENYFLKEAGYHDLLNATLRICSDAVLVAHVPDSDVQRSPLNTNFFI